MIKKLLTLVILSTMIFTTLLNPSIANQQNHGQYVSNIAKSTEPGPTHGQIVSEAARNKSQNDYALSFDGVNDYVEIPHNDIFNLENSLTIESWVKTTGSNVYILNKHISTYGNGYHFFIYPSGFAGFDIGSGVNGDIIVNDGNWHHIAVVLDEINNVLNLYVDGQLDQSNSLTTRYPINTKSIEMGAMTTVWFFGTQAGILGVAEIDDVRIWNKALTQEEIQANMYREIQPQDGLVGYWQFDEGSENIAYDSSGNNNHGTLVNGPTWTTDTPF